MKLILTYFGEKNAKNCGNCYVCTEKNPTNNQQSLEKQILEALSKRAATIDELAIMIHFHQREALQENYLNLKISSVGAKKYNEKFKSSFLRNARFC